MALLDIRNLCVDIKTDQGLVRMIDQFSLKLEDGDFAALVGESGSGKSLIAKIICNEIQDNWIIYADRFRFDEVELLKLKEKQRSTVIEQKISFVSQARLRVLDPTRTIGKQMKQRLANHSFKGKWWRYFGWKKRRTIELLHRVGIQDHKDIMSSYPDEITDGQRQKVLIAMAIANQPSLLVADEPTNTLEGMTKEQIFKLLSNMNKNLGTTVLLASNDIQPVKKHCNYLSVIYCGQNVEAGPIENLFSQPHHPYTTAILNAMPDFTQPLASKSRLGTLKGNVPMLENLPLGCRFGSRCPFSQKACIQKPQMIKIKQQEFACHFPLHLRHFTAKNPSTSPLVVSL